MKIFNEMVELKAQKVQVILADQIRENISGIEWYTVEYGNVSIKLPRLHSDLKLVPGDKEILLQSKDTALEFLLHWNQSFSLWHYDKESDYPWVKSVWAEFYTQYLNSEWLEVTVDDSIFDVQLLDGILVERPTFAISVYCHKDIELSKNYVLFQWNNSIPYI